MGDRLKDKVALVSGAGSSGPGWGNGKATAVLFAREGARVFAVDINLEAALETKRMIEGEGGPCHGNANEHALRACNSARVMPLRQQLAMRRQLRFGRSAVWIAR